MITVLTHDPKFDVPLLEVALRLPEVAYVGAMGSRRTHDDRLARLREAGLTDKEIDRLSSPIGLDLGARTPEETAISIAAEIIAGRWGGSGERLASTDGRIHRETIRDRLSRATGSLAGGDPASLLLAACTSATRRPSPTRRRRAPRHVESRRATPSRAPARRREPAAEAPRRARGDPAAGQPPASRCRR